MRGVSLALAAFWAVCFPGLGPAQTITGEITGTVTDQSGAMVAGAALELIREGIGAARSGVTNQSGIFVFAMLPPGTYTLKVNSAGFRNFEQSGIVLTANERVSVGQIQLSVGAAAEIVTVSADTSQISTESVQTSARLTPLQLDRTVVRGRDVMNMVKLLPGVSQGAIRDGAPAGETDTGLGNDLGGLYGTFTPNISGTRSYWNTVTLDGQMGSDAHLVSLFNEVTSVDAIGEVNVVLTNYNAEYGRNSGPQINMVSKSGSSEFHGSLYWYKRHEQFNANGFFNNRDGLPKPPFRYDTLGGTIGGPIYIPGKWNVSKSKAFFFYSREDWRVKEPLNIGRLTTPTALERQGDFSQTLDQNNRLIIIRDPVTGSAFPGNVIPQSRISRNGQALLNCFPDAQRHGSERYRWGLQLPVSGDPRQTQEYQPAQIGFHARAERHHHDSRQELLVGWSLLGRHGGGELQLAAVPAPLPVHGRQRQGGLDPRDRPEHGKRIQHRVPGPG